VDKFISVNYDENVEYVEKGFASGFASRNIHAQKIMRRVSCGEGI
jgi:hypothetical protein